MEKNLKILRVSEVRRKQQKVMELKTKNILARTKELTTYLTDENENKITDRNKIYSFLRKFKSKWKQANLKDQEIVIEINN